MNHQPLGQAPRSCLIEASSCNSSQSVLARRVPGAQTLSKLFHRPEAACGALRGQACEPQDFPYRKRIADPVAAPIYAG